VMW